MWTCAFGETAAASASRLGFWVVRNRVRSWVVELGNRVSASGVGGWCSGVGGLACGFRSLGWGMEEQLMEVCVHRNRGRLCQQMRGYFSSSSLSSPELIDTKVYQPDIRVLLGAASHICEVTDSELRVRGYAFRFPPEKAGARSHASRLRG